MKVTKGVYFNGSLLTLPGAYSAMESSMTSTKSGNNAKMVALIGECTGGIPGEVLFLPEPSIAKSVLKSGDLLKAAQKAWNPVSKTKEGVSLGGANVIAVIRSNQATKGSSEVLQSYTIPAVPGKPAVPGTPAIPAVPSAIGAVTPNIGADTTGSLITSGTYIGSDDITITVTITSDSVQPLADATFNWKTDQDTDYRMEVDGSCTTSSIALLSGVSIQFADGDYSKGDTFVFSCTHAVPEVPAIPEIPAVPEIPEKVVTKTAFKVQSKDWGADANKIYHKLLDGTAPKTKKFVIFDSKADSYETYDNVGAMFYLRYTGGLSYADVSIIHDETGKSIRLQTHVGNSKEDAILDIDVELDRSVYRTVKAFATYLSGYENYEVSVFPSYNPELTVNDMDHMEQVSLISDESIPITGILPDLQKSVAFQSQLCEITDCNRSITEFQNYDFVALQGGSEGESPMSWASYFDKLSAYDIPYIVPLTEDMSILAECLEHVEHMSGDMGRERRMVCGRGNGITLQTAINDAQRLASDRCQYVYPGMYDTDDFGEVKLYPAYILAAQHAGRAAFLPDGEATTHDTYKIAAIEKELEPAEITQLLNAGVVTFEFLIAENNYSASSVRCVQDITTYTQSLDPLYVERAIGITADNLNKDIRKTLEHLLVGKRTTTATLTSARNHVISILKQRVKDDIITAYKDVIIYKKEGAIYVEYSVAPAEPTNFVLVVSHFYSGELAQVGGTSSSGDYI